MSDNTQLLRAVSNAMWPKLRRRHWEVERKTRAISPTGAPRSANYSGGGHIPGPEPTIELLEHTRYLEATATSQETRLGYGIGIELTYVAHCAALATISHAAAAEYEEALDDRTLRVYSPFTWKGSHYRRNELLTRRAAHALQAVAAAATITVLTPEQDAELLSGGGMRAMEVFAAVERAGRT